MKDPYLALQGVYPYNSEKVEKKQQEEDSNSKKTVQAEFTSAMNPEEIFRTMKMFEGSPGVIAQKKGVDALQEHMGILNKIPFETDYRPLANFADYMAGTSFAKDMKPTETPQERIATKAGLQKLINSSNGEVDQTLLNYIKASKFEQKKIGEDSAENKSSVGSEGENSLEGTNQPKKVPTTLKKDIFDSSKIEKSPDYKAITIRTELQNSIQDLYSFVDKNGYAIYDSEKSQLDGKIARIKRGLAKGFGSLTATEEAIVTNAIGAIANNKWNGAITYGLYGGKKGQLATLTDYLDNNTFNNEAGIERLNDTWGRKHPGNQVTIDNLRKKFNAIQTHRNKEEEKEEIINPRTNGGGLSPEDEKRYQELSKRAAGKS